MWCVMHVEDGKEPRAERFIEGLLGDRSGGCFHLTRFRRKKYGGKWRTVQEPLLPGYVFIATEDAEQLYRELESVSGYELLGSSAEYVSRLEDGEADFIERIAGKGSRAGEIALSLIKVEEDGEITVLSGPLLSVEGQVRKIDFHKRVAEVETKLFGEKKVMYLGVEFEDVVCDTDKTGA